MTSEVALQVDSPLPEPDNNCNGIQAKKRRMGNEMLDLLNDSGIPMDGVELDSSSSNSHLHQHQQQLATTTNSTKTTTSGTSSSTNRASSNNEALATRNSLALSISDESKCSEHFGLDYNQAADITLQSLGKPNETSHYSASLDDSFHGNAQHDRAQPDPQRNYIRSFGDLFDDDDLD